MNRDDGFLSDGYGVVNLGDPDGPGEFVPPKKKRKRVKDSDDKTPQTGPEVKTDE